MSTKPLSAERWEASSLAWQQNHEKALKKIDRLEAVLKQMHTALVSCFPYDEERAALKESALNAFDEL